MTLNPGDRVEYTYTPVQGFPPMSGTGELVRISKYLDGVHVEVHPDGTGPQFVIHMNEGDARPAALHTQPGLF